MKQLQIVGDDRLMPRLCLGFVKISSEEKSSDESAVGEVGSTPVGVEYQAVLRKERADQERRLEALAVEVLTALGERDGAIRDAELRAGGALVAVFSGLHQATRASGAHEPTKDFEVRGVQR